MAIIAFLTQLVVHDDYQTESANGLVDTRAKSSLAYDASVDLLCTMCDQTGVQSCGNCGAAKYCSAECQKADWAHHHMLCKSLTEFGAAKRPSPTHRRVLYFPVSGTQPQWLWVKFENDYRLLLRIDDEELVAFCKANGLVDAPDKRTQVFLNFTQPLQGAKIGHGLVSLSFVHEKETRRISSDISNLSVNALAAPGLIRPWMGPFLIFSSSRTDDGSRIEVVIHDVTMRDVRHAIDFFTCWHENPCVPYPSRFPGATVPGVQINDPRDAWNVKLGCATRMATVSVPRHWRSTADWPCAIPFSLGLRWYIRQGHPMPRYRAAGDKYSFLVWHTADLDWLRYLVAGRQTTGVGNTAGHDGHANGGRGGSGSTAANGHIKAARENGRGSGGTTASKLSSQTGRPDPDVTSYEYWKNLKFRGSVIITQAKGTPIHAHHVMALNGYLDLAAKTQAEISRTSFASYWDLYKRKNVKQKQKQQQQQQQADKTEAASTDDLANLCSPYELEDAEGPYLIGGEMTDAVMKITASRSLWDLVVGRGVVGKDVTGKEGASNSKGRERLHVAMI